MTPCTGFIAPCRNVPCSPVVTRYSSLNSTNYANEDTIMNIAKHMEFIFIAALGLASASTLANAAVPAYRTAQMSPLTSMPAAAHGVHAVGAAPMAVVTITGKRLSAAQKAALGN
jgi:hypothetical protein